MEIDDIDKEEPVWDEHSIVESSVTHLAPKDEDPKINNQTVGPENGAIRCLFKVSKRNFMGQRFHYTPLSDWLVRAHSIEAFRSYLWELVEPHVKQAVRVDTRSDGQITVSWGDPVQPTIEHAIKYVVFNVKKTRKLYSWDHLTSSTVTKWNNTTIIVCIHVYTTAVTSSKVYDVLRNTLLAPKKPAKIVKPRRTLPEEADGYNFRDEVHALRETFLQMRDLMHILDNRICLLEEKCDQRLLTDEQHQQPQPRTRDDPERREIETVEVKPQGNPDPLLYQLEDEELDIKEEESDDEREESEEHYD